MNIFFLLITATFLFSSSNPDTIGLKKTTLPTSYSFDRFFVTPITLSGDTLQFYTDTGGGANMLFKETAESLKVETKWIQVGKDSVQVTEMPNFVDHASIPSPSFQEPFGKKLVVRKGQGHAGDGFLGRSWFAGRIWELNYPEKSMSMLSDVDWSGRSQSHRVELGFQSDSTGTPVTYFPRITIEVDGESIDLLFDTGAMVRLNGQAMSQLNLEEPTIGTSFISESIFKKWQKNHPDWQVIPHADKAFDMPMIKVPEIRVADHEVGPVWFTIRPDKNFTEYMSQWMDKKVYGALGGSALKYFKIIVDYPNQLAEFQKMDL